MNFFGIAGSPLNALAQEEQFPSEQFVKTGANATQYGGEHYKQFQYEPWEVLQDWMTPEQFEGFLLGSAVAYLARFNTTSVPGKGGVLDVKKAAHYCQKLIEVIETKNESAS